MAEVNRARAVFVSSTFRDMQSERDVLRDKVLPALNAFAADYNKAVELIDLRWGVDTHSVSEAEEGVKVLKTCFEEIDRSRPCIIVLLGGRYGWIPPEKDVLEAFSYLDYELENVNQSVTAMEIIYGAFREDKKPMVFFYFREGPPAEDIPEEKRWVYYDTDDSAVKLEELKKRIRDKFGDRVSSYTGLWRDGEVSDLDEFAKLVAKDLIRAFSEEWGEPSGEVLKWYEEDEEAVQHLIYSKIRRYAGRTKEIGEIKRFALGTEGTFDIKLLTGESGLGKTAMLCKVINDLEDEECLVLPFFCGITPRSAISAFILKMLVYRLQSFLGDEIEIPVNQEDLKKEFRELLVRAETLTRVVIIVDSIDQLIPDETGGKLLWLRGVRLENTRVILSCIDSFTGVMQSAAEAGAEVTEVAELSDDDIQEIVQLLADSHHKQFDERIIPHILKKRGEAKKRAAASPLFLSLLVQNLVMMNRYDHAEIDKLAQKMKPVDAIYKFMSTIVDECPASPSGAYKSFMHRVFDLVGLEFTVACLHGIAISRRGLRESDISRILKYLEIPWNSADFAWLRQLISPHLTRHDAGQWNFSHQSLRAAFIKIDEYTDIPDFSDKIKLGAAIAMLEDDSFFAQRELMHHLWVAGRDDAAADAIEAAVENPVALQSYAEGLRDIAFAEDMGGVEGRFIEKIFESAHNKSDGHCLAAVKVIRLMYFDIEYSGVSLQYRTDMLGHALLMATDKNRAYTGRLQMYSLTIFNRLCGCYITAGNYANAHDYASISVKMADLLNEIITEENELYIEMPEFAADSYGTMAQVLNVMSKYTEALEFTEKALGQFEELNQRSPSISSERALNSYKASLAMDYHRLGYNEKAAEIGRQSIAEMEKDTVSGDAEGVQHAMLLLAEAENLAARGDFDDAEQHCLKALDIAESVYEASAETEVLAFVGAARSKLGDVYRARYARIMGGSYTADALNEEGKAYRQKAADAYKESSDVYRYLANQTRKDEDMLLCMEASLQHLSYHVSSNYKNNKAVMEALEGAVKICGIIHRDLDNADSLRVLGKAYLMLAEVLNTGGKSKAERYYFESVSTHRELYQRQIRGGINPESLYAMREPYETALKRFIAYYQSRKKDKLAAMYTAELERLR